MIESSHPTIDAIELLAIGASDDADLVAHVSSCDACATKLVAEARLELALGELHAFRSGVRHLPRGSRILVPALVLAAAAAIFFLVRSRAPIAADHELRADPSAIVAVGSAPPAADVEKVIAELRPRFKKCFTASTDTPADGSIVLAATVAADGSVADVAVASRTGLTDAAVDCLVATMKSARFPASGATTTVNVPLSFVKR